MFQTWLYTIENHSNKYIKTLYINSTNKFILAKLKNFYEKKNIAIKYITPYIHKENCIVE